MKQLHFMALQGQLAEHVVKIEFDLTLGSPAPFITNPDAPGFGDPGDPGGAAIERVWLLRPRPKHLEYKPPRERLLPKATTLRLRENQELEDHLYQEAVGRIAPE